MVNLVLEWRSKPRHLILALLLCLSIVISGPGIGAALAQGTKDTPTAELDPAFAVKWMQLFYEMVQGEKVNAPAASRVYAYAGATLWESVVPGLPGYVSLSTQLKGMPEMPPLAADAAYDYPSIANAALYTVMTGLLPSDAVKKAAADLRAKQTADRKGAVDPQIVDRSLAQGDKLGAALLDWASKDNYKEAISKAYTVDSSNPQFWVPTAPGQKAVGAYWGTLRPFSLPESDACNVIRNIDFSTDKTSTFYKQALEVKTIQENLTQEQKNIADYWVDTPGITGAPAGHWISIANQLVSQQDLKLGKAAEMYALVGMALGDAFISCWDMKYKDSLLRPITFITRYIKQDWQSYIQTPPFPTYPSGHSVASQAAAEVLTGLFGTTAFTDATHTKRLNLPARAFTSFQAAASEAAISRLYGGIHYRFDIENGLRQGACVGQQVLSNIHLKANS